MRKKLKKRKLRRAKILDGAMTVFNFIKNKLGDENLATIIHQNLANPLNKRSDPGKVLDKLRLALNTTNNFTVKDWVKYENQKMQNRIRTKMKKKLSKVEYEHWKKTRKEAKGDKRLKVSFPLIYYADDLDWKNMEMKYKEAKARGDEREAAAIKELMILMKTKNMRVKQYT